MSVEVGAKVKGKVTGITNFGAFVDIGNNTTGLVHISEISDKYVKDIHDILTVGDEVTVKVMSVGDDGKIGLSIRKAADKPHREDSHPKHFNKSNNRDRRENNNRSERSFAHGSRGFQRKTEHKNQDFDSMLAGFLKESDERLTSLRRNTEGKRGGRGGRRS